MKLLPKDVRKAFDSLFLLVTWLIWKEPNSQTFDKFATIYAGLIAAVDHAGGRALGCSRVQEPVWLVGALVENGASVI